MGVCACSLVEAPAQSCSAHEHSDGHDGHKQNGSDAQCPCVACHSCQHLPVLVPEAVALTHPDYTAEIVALVCPSPRPRAAEIFTPPKLG